MFRKFLSLGFMALVLVTLLAGTVQAQEDAKRHPEFAKFVNEGGTIEFLGHAYGLDGWILINKQGNPQYAYTTKEGGLVIGMLIGNDGKVETQRQLAAWQLKTKGGQDALPGAAASNLGGAEKVYAEVEKSNWVQMGSDDAPYIYMFANVNCDHCQKFWKDIAGAVKQGRVAVRFVPFGAKEANRDGGAALLSVANPMAAWEAYLAGDKAVLGADKIADGALDKVAANTKLFGDRRMQGPPFTMYRKPSNGRLQVIAGRPDNSMLVLADLMKAE